MTCFVSLMKFPNTNYNISSTPLTHTIYYLTQEHTSTLIAPPPEEVPVLAHLFNKPLTARELMQVSLTQHTS